MTRRFQEFFNDKNNPLYIIPIYTNINITAFLYKFDDIIHSLYLLHTIISTSNSGRLE